MTVETATKISQLNAVWPAGTDPKSEGDNHLRLLKSCLQAVFDDTGAFLKPTLPVYGNAGSTMIDPVWKASADLTKVVSLDQSNQTTGTTRRIRVPNMDSVSGVWEPIGDYTFSAVANFPVINLAPFRKLRLTGLTSGSVAGGPMMQISSNNGSTYDAGATSYLYQHWQAAGASGAAAGGSQNAISMTGGPSLDAGTYAGFDMLIEGFAGTTVAAMRTFTRGGLQSGGVLYMSQGTAAYSVAGRNALRLLPLGGGTMTGTLTVEGVRG